MCKKNLDPNSSHYTKGPAFTKDTYKTWIHNEGTEHILPTFSLIKGYYCGTSTVGRIKKSQLAWKSGFQSRVQKQWGILWGPRVNGYKHKRLNTVTAADGWTCLWAFVNPPGSATWELKVLCRKLEVLGKQVEARATWLVLLKRLPTNSQEHKPMSSPSVWVRSYLILYPQCLA